jgi:hypothetical protein
MFNNRCVKRADAGSTTAASTKLYAAPINLTNDSYVVVIATRSGRTERYLRDIAGWKKVSMRGREFRMTAEQVLNHVLPALAGVKAGVTLRVEHTNH